MKSKKIPPCGSKIISVISSNEIMTKLYEFFRFVAVFRNAGDGAFRVVLCLFFRRFESEKRDVSLFVALFVASDVFAEDGVRRSAIEHVVSYLIRDPRVIGKIDEVDLLFLGTTAGNGARKQSGDQKSRRLFRVHTLTPEAQGPARAAARLYSG